MIAGKSNLDLTPASTCAPDSATLGRISVDLPEPAAAGLKGNGGDRAQGDVTMARKRPWSGPRGRPDGLVQWSFGDPS